MRLWLIEFSDYFEAGEVTHRRTIEAATPEHAADELRGEFGEIVIHSITERGSVPEMD